MASNTFQDRATPEEIKRARNLYCDRGYDGDDIEVDDDAMVSRPADPDEHGTWVQAWVCVPTPHSDEEEEAEEESECL